MGFHRGSAVKNPLANAGDMSLIPGSGRSPGEGNGNLLQYSCLENPMDRGTRQVTVCGGHKRITLMLSNSNYSNRMTSYWLCWGPDFINLFFGASLILFLFMFIWFCVYKNLVHYYGYIHTYRHISLAYLYTYIWICILKLSLQLLGCKI